MTGSTNSPPLATASTGLVASALRGLRVAVLSAGLVMLPNTGPLQAQEVIDQSTATSGATSEATSEAASATALPVNLGEEIALRAIALIGTRYRYGGADLDGFDCSGLVFYIHQALGFLVPRTAADQQRAAQHIKRSELQPGDLLFFRTTRSKRISHVGVYVGENRFVHAPQSGKLIELKSIDDYYYGPRLISSGRLHPAS